MPLLLPRLPLSSNGEASMRKPPIKVIVLLLFLFQGLGARPSLGDSISTYKNQMPAGPLADAVNTGIKALQQRDFDKAEASFRQALKIEPNEPHALVLMADVAILRGKRAEALPYLRT